MTGSAAEQTVRALVSLGFSESRSREAVASIHDPSSTDQAVDWLLSNGEEDKGGAVSLVACPHAGTADLVAPDALTFGRPCADGCGVGEDWVCLTCGQTRCGRYGARHSMEHWRRTRAEAEHRVTAAEVSRGAAPVGHCLAISLGDLSIWCYECNAYVEPQGLEQHVQRMQQLKFGCDEGGQREEGQREEGPRPGSPIPVWAVEAHGRSGTAAWPLPTLVRACTAEARPGYRTMLAHEYIDSKEVQQAKAQVVAEMIRRSKHCVAYTGAGISTAAGIRDYATKATGSVASTGSSVSAWAAQPTLAHRVLVALHREGWLRHWVQQNHDGLPQKAGFPQQDLNEIHGAWYDPSNPVVPMDGTLRPDLIDSLVEWEDRADMCLALGTSMVGMNADRIPLAASRRDPGTVIVALQRTQHDRHASIRVFGTVDRFMGLVAEALGLAVPEAPLPRQLTEPPVLRGLRYGADGAKDPQGSLTLDLRPGAQVRLVGQPDWDKARYGDVAVLVEAPAELAREGHLAVRLGPSRSGETTVRVLGRWWLEAAQSASVQQLPVVPLGGEGSADGTAGGSTAASVTRPAASCTSSCVLC